MDDSTHHRYPDEKFKDCQKKSDGTPALNRYDDSNRPDGHFGDAGRKGQ